MHVSMPTPFDRRRPPTDELHEVYRDNVAAVYAFFAYRVGTDTAEDLTAGTFERVVRSWRSFDPRQATPRTWIIAIARNLLTDHFRRERWRRGPSLDEHPALLDGLVASDEPPARYMRFESAKDWLSQLSAREREIVAMRYGADLSTADIARLLDLSEANVHQIASRALRRLRDRVEAAAVERVDGT
jgi:RNA polymerase sigma-70 factor (ECF subfamily)